MSKIITNKQYLKALETIERFKYQNKKTELIVNGEYLIKNKNNMWR